MSLIILSGPCGVGKTSVAKLLADYLGASVVDLDKTELRREARRSFLDVVGQLCSEHGDSLILDVGGSTLFRAGADHDEQRRQLQVLRDEGAQVVLLTCERSKLKQRYMAFPGSSERCFDGDSDVWLREAQGNWRQVADVELNSTEHDAETTAKLIALRLLAHGR